MSWYLNPGGFCTTPLGSLHLKKIPPMPVTFFIGALSMVVLLVSDRNAYPKKKVATSARMVSVVFFIVTVVEIL